MVFAGTPEETGTYAAATNSGAPPGIMAGGQMCRLASAGVRGLVMFSDPLPEPALRGSRRPAASFSVLCP